jgi:phosphatidylserine/phosphatidylglycerophosphate/cardiolipin synthase-like enzyme
VNLIVTPDDGIAKVVTAIRRAKRSVRVTIFRCDLAEVEKALGDAVTRGVQVHALIAHTNREGEKMLRKLELRLLGAGITVSRTDDDLVRYHDKLLIVDETTLFVLGFNFTRLDGRSRSMGVVTRKRRLVAEAEKLFEADATRQPYSPDSAQLLVSPFNSRASLAKHLQAARRELLVYDPRILDRQMLRILNERAKAGVDVRIIGRVGAAARELRADVLPMRLHLRAILRDQRELFVGSQSLRLLELDRRREVGVLVRDPRAIKRFKAVFEEDWATTERGRREAEAEKAA